MDPEDSLAILKQIMFKAQQGEADDGPPSGEDHPAFDCGCTAVTALVDLTGNTLTVANAGDSRCVVSRRGRAVPMSYDHKPKDQEERTRIEKAGGVVTDEGRIDGNLNLSRAFGDFTYKSNEDLSPREQKITCEPDIRVLKLTPDDDFIVLTCDGIWERFTRQWVVSFVHKELFGHNATRNQAAEQHAAKVKLSKICEDLCDHCLSEDPDETDCLGCDNMTVQIVLLPRRSIPVDGAAAGTSEEEAEEEEDGSEGSKKRKKQYVLRPRKCHKTK